jgi:hypothetical protein
MRACDNPKDRVAEKSPSIFFVVPEGYTDCSYFSLPNFIITSVIISSSHLDAAFCFYLFIPSENYAALQIPQ